MNINELFSSLTEKKREENTGEVIWWDYAIVVTLDIYVYIYNGECCQQTWSEREG